MLLPQIVPDGTLNAMLTPTVRLGVTGLARAGKTVFITALVRNLMAGGRLPFFVPAAEGRLASAHLEPQPNDAIPRFDYEAHLEKLCRTPPEWPDSTRQISQLRLVLTYQTRSRLKRVAGRSAVNVDIIDYPGEWLLDLALLDESYTQWSARALAAVRSRSSTPASKAYLEFLAGIGATSADGEQTAIAGADLFKQHLLAARAGGSGVATLGPGRFLLPGDLAGSPLLTFFPLDVGSERDKRTSLRAMMERRYESYRTHVVRPFFRNHFSRLDRQIVLVDVLSALNSGAAAVHDLEDALFLSLKAFRPGSQTWLAQLFRPRIDKVLFAATKADHLHHTSHDRLEAILRLLTERAAARITGAGADIGVLALASLRATREAEARDGDEKLPCIAGVPLPGEEIGGTVFDGIREAVVFPGDLPQDASAALERAGTTHAASTAAFVKFRPPLLQRKKSGSEVAPMPHIRLDRALEFRIGDWLT